MGAGKRVAADIDRYLKGELGGCSGSDQAKPLLLKGGAVLIGCF
jgi:hypothetical protein